MRGKATMGPGDQTAKRGTWVRKLAEGDKRIVILVVAALALFYLVTAAQNLGDTDDSYAFAYRAEHFTLDHFSDPRLLLYHFSMRLLYLGASGIGWDVSALVLMRGVSALCAAASLVLLFRIAARSLGVTNVTAVLAALLLGVCYGFWRYAAEVEVYAPAIFLILLVLHGLSKFDGGGLPQRVVHGALWGFIAGLAILAYQPSVIPLCFAFPWLLLSRERAPSLISYLALVGLVVSGGYLLAYLAYWPEPLGIRGLENFLSQRSDEFMVPPFSLRTVVVSMIRTAFALGHDIVSANWIFAFDPLADLVQRAYPTNVITEEIFLAKKAGVLAYLPALSLSLLIVLGVWVLLRAWHLPKGLLLRRPMIVILLWLGINGAIIGRLNPAGVEAWIMVLPPLALVAAAFVIEPCVRRGRVLLIATFVTVLFLHNLVGGMALMFDPQAEYNRVKGAWVIDNARSNDLVIVPADADLVEALRYLSPAQVALIAMGDIPKVAGSLANQNLESLYTRTRGRDFDHYILRSLIENARESGGRVIVFSDFFVPAPSQVQANWPEFAAIRGLREMAIRVYESPDAGETYVLPVPVQ
jgi:hypothetical protein